MDGEQARTAAALLDPDHRVGRQPVVTVDDVESSQKVFHLEYTVDKGAAHAVDVIDKVHLGWIGTPVIVHPIDDLMNGLARSSSCEDVYVVSLAGERPGQLSDVDAYPSNGDRMK